MWYSGGVEIMLSDAFKFELIFGDTVDADLIYYMWKTGRLTDEDIKLITYQSERYKNMSAIDCANFLLDGYLYECTFRELIPELLPQASGKFALNQNGYYETAAPDFTLKGQNLDVKYCPGSKLKLKRNCCLYAVYFANGTAALYDLGFVIESTTIDIDEREMELYWNKDTFDQAAKIAEEKILNRGAAIFKQKFESEI